jgi:hypothetical protein
MLHARIVGFDRRRIGAALVDRDLLRRSIPPIALRRNRGAALRSRLAVIRKSTVAPALSTVRYKYFHMALVHIRDEAQDDPSPEPLCDNAYATKGIRATGRKHPI